jgi:hypothetical protein
MSLPSLIPVSNDTIINSSTVISITKIIYCDQETGYECIGYRIVTSNDTYEVWEGTKGYTAWREVYADSMYYSN